MSGLRRLSIKQRLFINGIALVAAMVVMLLILFYQSSKLTSLATTQQLVEQIAADVLMLRRHEKDFVMRTELKYQQRHSDHLDKMASRASQLQLLLQQHSIDDAALQRFSQLTQSYQQSFSELVSQQQRLGLTVDDGLLGELRSAARQIELRFDGLARDDLMVLLLQLRRAEKDFLLRKDLAYQQQFASIVAQLTSQSSADGDSGRLIQQYQRSFEALVSASQQMGLDETQGVTGVMRKAIQSTEESLKALQAQTSDAISAAVKNTQQLALLVFALVLAAVLLLVALTSRSILRPVLDVCKTIGLIRSQNDFRMRVTVAGKDEMTALATDFNSMLGDFQDLIKTVNQALEMLDVATDELAKSTSDTSTGMQMQQNETDMVAAAVTEMGATINEISNNTDSTAAKADAMNKNAQSGRSEVQQTVDRITRLSERLQDATAVVAELEKDSKTIGSVLINRMKVAGS